MSRSSHVDALPYAHGGPLLEGVMKLDPEDFRVDEVLGFELEGKGEHCCVHVRVTGQNTAYVARTLARWAGIPVGHVSFSGQKDRHAVTTQWFSLHMPGKPDPEPAALDHPGIEILAMTRHSRKLKRGTHIGNAFVITLRNLVPDDIDRHQVEQRLQAIFSRGVPNYFGAQRFGFDDANLVAAMNAVREGRLPRDNDRRAWIFSSLRSYLFNLWLADRVSRDLWETWQPGDLLQLRGRRGFFVPEVFDDDIRQRLEQGELGVAGLLPGDGEIPQKDQALLDLQQVWQDHGEAIGLLRRQRVSLEVRSARLIPESASFSWENKGLRLEFVLPRGCFATAVVRELMRDAPRSSMQAETD